MQKFINKNGREYVIINQIGDYGIVQDVSTLQIVVTWKLNLKNKDWGQGYYYDIENILSAIELYKIKLGEQNENNL